MAMRLYNLATSCERLRSKSLKCTVGEAAYAFAHASETKDTAKPVSSFPAIAMKFPPRTRCALSMPDYRAIASNRCTLSEHDKSSAGGQARCGIRRLHISQITTGN